MRVRTEPLVWAKDSAGNRFLCPLDAIQDANSVGEDQKHDCVDDASRLTNPRSVPGEGRMRFTTYSISPN